MSQFILFKLIIREVILPLFFSMGALMLLFLIGKLFAYIEPLLAAGITLGEFVRLNLMMMPIFLYILIPICTLLGVLIGFIRLSRDSEIIALFACGISPKALFFPLGVISITALLTSLFVSALVVPYAKRQTRTFMENITERAITRGIPERIFFNPMKNLTFFVDKSIENGRKFQGVYIRDARRKGAAYTIVAKKGMIISNPDGGKIVLKLINGMLLRGDRENKFLDFIRFNRYVLSLSSDEKARGLRRGEMTTIQLYEEAQKPGLKPGKKRKLLIEFHKRLGIPFGAFILALLAAPLGIFFGRGGISLGICAGLIAFLAYYMAILLGTTLAQNGIILPFFGVWIPNLLLALTAFFSYKPLFNRGPVIA